MACGRAARPEVGRLQAAVDGNGGTTAVGGRRPQHRRAARGRGRAQYWPSGRVNWLVLGNGITQLLAQFSYLHAYGLIQMS